MYLHTVRPLLNMLLLAAFTSFLSLVQAEAFIAFDSVSCTSDISLFLKTEFSNALQLVVQTAAWVNPPLYDPIIQGYVETLFGPAQSDRDPVSFPRGVFSGLMGFNTTMFADESELNNQEDLVSAVAAAIPFIQSVSQKSLTTKYSWYFVHLNITIKK